MSDASPSGTARPVSVFRKVLAAVLDFFTVFIAGGVLIGNLSGGATDGGFSLSGPPAFVLFALIAAYFVIGTRYAGGTIWQRILRTR